MKEKSESGNNSETASLSRRTWLKALGVGGSLLTVESGTATAASHGYGAGGYGDGEYGDPSTALTVTTDAASDVGETVATVDGSLTDLGDASAADVYFQYRKATVSSWSSTGVQTLSSTGSFSATVTGLSDGTEYEFRAVASASDGSSTSGATSSFTTVENAIVVSTESATSVGETAATLNGSVTDLGNASSADVYFEYRNATVSGWSSTAVQTLSSTGSFSAAVSDLNDSTEYEFRAVASASDGDSDSGATSNFTTVADLVAVSTESATSVGETAATLNGSVTDLGNASSADTYFEYRAADVSSWTSTSVQTLTSTGSFSASVTGLDDGAEYEFRAAAEASDGDTDTGDLTAFTTVIAESDPVIDSFGVSEAGSPNPHAQISADWAVSDADGNLSAVTVSVSDTNGTTVRSRSTSVSGESAAGSDSFKIKHNDSDVYDVTLSVEDDSGASTSETRSVSA